MFIIEVLFNVDEATLDDNKNMQIKKSTKNSNTVKLTENNNIILLTKNDNTVKSINYNDFMNITFEFSAHTIID